MMEAACHPDSEQPWPVGGWTVGQGFCSGPSLERNIRTSKFISPENTASLSTFCETKTDGTILISTIGLTVNKIYGS